MKSILSCGVVLSTLLAVGSVLVAVESRTDWQAKYDYHRAEHRRIQAVLESGEWSWREVGEMVVEKRAHARGMYEAEQQLRRSER